MRRLSWAIALAAMWVAAPTVAQARDTAPAPTGQITFLYYKDLPGAARFYERLLGKTPELTPDWVRLFRVTSTATIGLVDATGGAMRPSDDKPVIVTIVVNGTAAVDRWYDRVRGQGIGIVQERKTTRLDARRSIHAFMFNDPEGYRIEILSWVRTPRG